MRLNRESRWLVVVLVLLFGGSTAAQETPTPAAVPAPPDDAAARERLLVHGFVGTEVQQVRAPNDHLLVVRGILFNPYETKVDGVRLHVAFFTAGDNPRELDRLVVDIDLEVAAKSQQPFNREITTNYSRLLTRLDVVAFAKTRDGKELPPASPELIAEASTKANIILANVFVPVFQAPTLTSFSLQ